MQILSLKKSLQSADGIYRVNEAIKKYLDGVNFESRLPYKDFLLCILQKQG